ncbi:MAG: bifunctional metallophosphatase/5'-nucleotidase, partial [Deltaproteobacteria bacterium]|nr:bifunctional metallophosphatase/5'-nucleotidase [Deltaproteobacteria bacterium]
DDDGTLGGVARLKTLVDEIRAGADHPVLLFDSGDFMAGALFQMLVTEEAAELQMMEHIGYDAITLGNHEFDWGPQTVGEMITTADGLGVEVPILAANVVPHPDDPDDDALAAHIDSGRIRDTMVLEVGEDLKIGLFGALGDGAQQVTPGVAPASFSPFLEAAGEAVAELEASEPDLVIALSHAGVEEDIELALEDLGIEVILGGHSHTALAEPIQMRGTTIVQAGAYTRFLTQTELEKVGLEWQVTSTVLHTLDDTIEGDADTTDMVDGFLTRVQEDHLDAMGYEFDEPIAWIRDDIGVTRSTCKESPLGNLITDAYQTQLTALDPDHPIDFAFEAQGVIRDFLLAGDTGVQAFSDVFRVLPLGGGNDGRPGYALAHFYVDSSEVYTACEVTATVAPEEGCNYFIEISSNLRCTIDMNAFPTRRVTLAERWTGTEWEAIDAEDTDTLYHVAVNTYVANLMSLLEELSGGALSVSPKTASGSPFGNVDAMVFDADPVTGGVQEYKTWEALVDYADSFPDTDWDGASEIPDSYTMSDERLIGYDHPTEEPYPEVR